MSTKRKCPECGREIVEVADRPDDWLVCLNCLHSEKVEKFEEEGNSGKKPETGKGRECE